MERDPEKQSAINRNPEAASSRPDGETVLAKVTDTAEGQQIELPAGFRLRGQSIYVRRAGDVILLIPADNPWASLLDSLDMFSEDYMEDRCQPMPQAREQI